MVFLLFISMILTIAIFLIVAGILICPGWAMPVLAVCNTIILALAATMYKVRLEKIQKQINLMAQAINFIIEDLKNMEETK